MKIMQTGWKVYFWFYIVLVIFDVLTSITFFQKYSVGDWISKALEILIIVALYFFAYKKVFIKQIVWKIFFSVNILYSILWSLYYNTSFRFLSAYLMPKYEIKLYQNVFSSPLLSWGIGIPCFLLSLPVLYALFALGFKKFKQEKVIEVPADAPYSGVAVASFVTGLVGLLLGPFLTIPALITGILGLRDTKKRHVKGVAFSWIGIMIFIFHTFYLYGIILMIVYFMQLPGTLSGDKDAVKHMSKDELQYYNAKLAKIKPNTSQEMLEKLLGKPYNVSNLASTGTYQYHCPEDLTMDCSITVTTSDKVISAISWLDIKRFMYTKNFTDSDKVYMYDKFDLTLTLLPTWSEYTYSEQELKDDPPITFMRSKNNSGYLYVYVNTLKDNDKFDIRQVIKDLEEPVTDFKQSSEQGLDIYEFRSKKDKELRYYSYRVKGKVIIGSLYYVKEAYFNKDELDEALNIAKTIDIVNK